ncbi:hypothetical protein CON64_18495 [Bacillus pseudomycoides]|nr:hypothetical protein CON64_18495 [Bacillus pseudomycoides]
MTGLGIESTYFDRCDVYRLTNVTQPNGSVKQGYKLLTENNKCALSTLTSSSMSSVSLEEPFEFIRSNFKLFISPKVDITQGDKVIVYYEGQIIITFAGEPYPYPTHSEIILKREEVNASKR